MSLPLSMGRGQEKLTKEWVEPDYETPTGNDSTAAEHPPAPNTPQNLRERIRKAKRKGEQQNETHKVCNIKY